MRLLLLLFAMVLGIVFPTFTQQLNLQFQLVDASSQQPVSAAHLFIAGSSFGATSDGEGNCVLSIPAVETQELVITHIAYETLVLSPAQYAKLVNGAALKMKSNGIDLSEIQILAKRGGQWKRNFRKFSKALLGEGKAASNCEILNPEVLRFEEKEGRLKATAIDLLEIDNRYLEYEIRLLLDELSIEVDGSSQYKGNGQFIDKSEMGNEKLVKLRERTYENSLQHFLRCLLESPDKRALNKLGYDISIQNFNQGVFKIMLAPEPQDLIQLDSVTGLYQLRFSEFLTVRHVNLKIQATNDPEVSISALEQQRFGSGATQSLSGKMNSAVSRLYKIEPLLFFDQRGNIINKSAMKEYGYWADQRLATTLPIDYKSFAPTVPPTDGIKQVNVLSIFKDFLQLDPQKRNTAYEFLMDNWSEAFVAPLLDIERMSTDDWHKKSIKTLLAKHAPVVPSDFFNGIEWLWDKPPSYGYYYADFKAFLYRNIDPVFQTYFNQRNEQSDIRLDEIVWGGVKQDGIPPLRSPTMINGATAAYLGKKDVVFGLYINNQAYAYPKRILAWHEFFTDEINGQSIAGVYCTLCGTFVIYDASFDGVKHDLGTSGFLYRSNKLMYDKATQSLWSTILGKPVLGPLINQGIELAVLPIETSTWEEWFKRYPDTKVVSLETGHERNYDEGEAYKEYFSTDNLMFPVPKRDSRLKNKSRVLIPRTTNYETAPLAIAVDYLKRKGMHQDQIGDQNILVLTDEVGASRVYLIGEEKFNSFNKGILITKDGIKWEVADKSLTGPKKISYSCIPAHETFWFAWVNVFPETRIIQ